MADCFLRLDCQQPEALPELNPLGAFDRQPTEVLGTSIRSDAAHSTDRRLTGRREIALLNALKREVNRLLFSGLTITFLKEFIYGLWLSLPLFLSLAVIIVGLGLVVGKEGGVVAI